jgi:hypothetical protein
VSNRIQRRRRTRRSWRYSKAIKLSDEVDPPPPALLFINDAGHQSNRGPQALAETLAEVFIQSLPTYHFISIPPQSLILGSADRAVVGRTVPPSVP